MEGLLCGNILSTREGQQWYDLVELVGYPEDFIASGHLFCEWCLPTVLPQETLWPNTAFDPKVLSHAHLNQPIQPARFDPF